MQQLIDILKHKNSGLLERESILIHLAPYVQKRKAWTSFDQCLHSLCPCRIGLVLSDLLIQLVNLLGTTYNDVLLMVYNGEGGGVNRVVA